MSRSRRWLAAGVGVGLAYLVLSKPKPRRTRREHLPPPPEQSRRIAGPGGELRVLDGGPGGLPALLVHGLGGSSDQWRPVLDRLRRRRRAVALDLRGHGGSSRVSGRRYAIADHASDVLAVADTLGLESFVLAGHSLGATVAAQVAASSPERVAGLLLVDASGDQTLIPRRELDGLRQALLEDPRAELAWHFQQLVFGAAASTAQLVRRDLERAAPDALRYSLESSLETSPLALLDRYPGPVASVVSPLNDLPYSLHRLRPTLPVQVLPGSHWLMMDRADEVTARVESLAVDCER